METSHQGESSTSISATTVEVTDSSGNHTEAAQVDTSATATATTAAPPGGEDDCVPTNSNNNDERKRTSCTLGAVVAADQTETFGAVGDVVAPALAVVAAGEFPNSEHAENAVDAGRVVAVATGATGADDGGGSNAIGSVTDNGSIPAAAGQVSIISRVTGSMRQMGQ